MCPIHKFKDGSIPKKTGYTERKKERHKFYNTQKWRLLRIQKLQNFPLCEECQKNEIIKLAEEIHHIIPFMQGNNYSEQCKLCYSMENLQSLCSECHKQIHLLMNETKW